MVDNVGGVFRLRPNPILKEKNKRIKDSYNLWILLDVVEQKTLIFANTQTEHRIEVETVYVKGHEPPDMIVLRGQLSLLDKGKASFEPFTEGISIDSSELVDDPLDRQSASVYKTLASHKGKKVSIRFPKTQDVSYSSKEATLIELTRHFAKLRVKPPTIRLRLPPKDSSPHLIRMNPPDIVSSPPYTKTISLTFIHIEEDDENECRPRLVIDHSHWDD